MDVPADSWLDLENLSVHLDPDGAPTEIRASSKPDDRTEAAMMRDVELELCVWISWEDRWRKDEDHWLRPVDLTQKQPSHRLIFHPDSVDRPDVRLLLVDMDTDDGLTIAWEKHEWYSKACDNGGAWTYTPKGWHYKGLFMPGNLPGTLCVERLSKRRPVSVRSNR